MEIKRKICLVGLGYVGLPLAVAFGKKQKVVGFELSEKKVELLKKGIDPAGELNSEELVAAQIEYTTNPSKIKETDFIIVAVPTPVDEHNVPDMFFVESASRIVGQNLSKGAIVVFESTVYPGVTEDICVPIMEKESGLKCGIDFKIGYSPERINPGDKEHTVEKITKVVSGMDEESLEIIAQVYGSVIKAGVFRATSIKVAEAAKVIENTQRDLNIGLMNELAVIFDKMNIKTSDVLEAAGTKWNFLKFTPGLVGGHCIGVDPYYLTYKAQELGYIPRLILAARQINDSMHTFVAQKIIKELIKEGVTINKAKVLILGLSFKEDVKDLRNSKTVGLIKELKEYGVDVIAIDHYVTQEEVDHEGFNVKLTTIEHCSKVDAIILAAPHKEFLEITPSTYGLLLNHKKLFFDIKGVYGKKHRIEGLRYMGL
ncbi:MAG: nucleotide sugar dehydrogenase [Candidatus Woesearchaeota archaeon]|jgi:UDP-N-acetyl-D-galactosamine dehydrogenase